MSATKLAAYVWASPNSVLGLAVALLMLIFGGRGRVIRGALEVSGGLVGSFFAAPAIGRGFRAVTLGHVILATHDAALAVCRAHEQAHVRQYELWGPVFLPAYFASSLWQLLRGRRAYRDNYFERQACDGS